MSAKISNGVITLTRGDTLRVKVRIKQAGKPYSPMQGDVVTFGLKRTLYDKKCIMTQDIPIDTMELYLAPEVTKELICGDYIYDIQIKFPGGDIYTFIPASKFKITGEVVV